MRKYSVGSVTLKPTSTLKVVGKITRFVAASVQNIGHYIRAAVKFGDAGDAMILFVKSTNVTKPLVAMWRIIENKRRISVPRTSSGIRKVARFRDEEGRVVRDRPRG